MARKLHSFPLDKGKGNEMDEITTLGNLICRKDAATYVRERWGRPCSTGLLNKLAVKGGGPAFRKCGTRWVVYDKADLDAWVLAQLGEPVTSTAEAKRGEAA